MKCVVAIVPRGQGEASAGAAVRAGAGGGTILLGRGTASNGILQLLGLGDSSKDFMFSLVEDGTAEPVRDALLAFAEATRAARPGILFTLPVLRFLRSGFPETPPESSSSAMESSACQLVNVIVNKGYADDAMAAARKAGATGGTVLCARGTARPDDTKFFGVPLVPEKEQLLVLVDAKKARDVLDAVRALPCFAEKGSGIAFTLPVSDFHVFGG